MKIESKRDYSISLIRLVATSFIITCHIMQCVDIELAWWFNVGVQMFLLMSGFLYGKRGIIENDLEFFEKNAIKILVDYYVVIIPVVLLFVIISPERLSIILVLKVLLTCDTLVGGEHLWYIPYCLFCYLITPFLSRYFDNCKNKQVVKHFLFFSVLVIIITEAFLNYFNSAWIFCYILGFFLGSISTYDKSKLYNNISFIIVVVAILLNSIQIIQDYVMNFELNGIISSLYPKFCNYAHVALGTAIFIVLKFIFSELFKKGYPNPVKKLCSFSDKYSYDIYLVHWFVIESSILLRQSTEINGIDIVWIVVITVVSAVFVNLISNCIKNKIKTARDI